MRTSPLAQGVLLAFIASVPFWLHNSYFLNVLIITAIFTIAAMSLNVLLGYTGQLSLGHAAFFGIGAYIYGLMSVGFSVPITDDFSVTLDPKPTWLALVAAIVLTGASGWFVGRLAFRVRGAYFVIVTISFAEVVRLIALNWVDLTGGPMALGGIPPLAFPHVPTFSGPLADRVAHYYLVTSAVVVAYALIRRVVRSKIGRAMIALRENENLARSVGVNVTDYLVFASILSAAVAGTAGALYAQYLGIVDPNVFLFINTVTMVIMVVAGGKGTLGGPLVGGLIFGLLPDALRSHMRPEVQWIIYGALMIVVVHFLPAGIVPSLENVWRNVTRRFVPRLEKSSHFAEHR